MAGRTAGGLSGQISAGSTDAFVAKYGHDGTLLWTSQFGSSGNDLALSVAVDADGAVFVAGRTDGTFPGQTSSGNVDAFVRKLGSDGAELWTVQFGATMDQEATSLSIQESGDIFVAGFVHSSDYSAGAAFVREYSSDGAEMSAQELGSNLDIAGPCVSVDVRGSVAIAGATNDGISAVTHIFEYGPDGAQVFADQFTAENTNSQGPSAVTVDVSGNLILTGYTYGVMPGQTSGGGQDGFIRKYGTDRVEVWTRQFGAARNENPLAISVDGQGNIFVAGASGAPQATEKDAFVYKYGANGEELWSAQVGTPSKDQGWAVSADANGDVFVAGDTSGTLPEQTSAGAADAFVTHLLVP